MTAFSFLRVFESYEGRVYEASEINKTWMSVPNVLNIQSVKKTFWNAADKEFVK